MNFVEKSVSLVVVFYLHRSLINNCFLITVVATSALTAKSVVFVRGRHNIFVKQKTAKFILLAIHVAYWLLFELSGVLCHVWRTDKRSNIKMFLYS